MKKLTDTMHTYVVELDHGGRTTTVSEVEGETALDAVQCARDFEGYGEVVSVMVKSCHDGYEMPFAKVA